MTLNHIFRLGVGASPTADSIIVTVDSIVYTADGVS